jgi:hypothetical protein
LRIPAWGKFAGANIMMTIGFRRQRASSKIFISILSVMVTILFHPPTAKAFNYQNNYATWGATVAGFTSITHSPFCDLCPLTWQNDPDLIPWAYSNNPFLSFIGPAISGTYHLGMSVGPNNPDNNPDTSGWGATGGGAVMRGSGIRTTDTTGAIAAGETVNSRDTSGSGGIFGTFDASRFFGITGGNQSAFFTGFFNYQGDSASLGAVPGAGAVIIGNAGSLHTNTYTFGGSLLYHAGTTYVSGEAAYNFGHINETNTLAGSTGSFNSNGYSVDAKLGNVFVLLNAAGAPSSAALPTKAPPKPTGGTLVGLDLSGHIGSFGDWANGFTDSTGFSFGTGQTQSGDIGARAELFALTPGYGLVWKPYVAGTVDQLFGFSSTQNIPNQAALAAGDVITSHPALTFGGAELGVVARGPGGLTVNVKGFYQASADTTVAGGSLTVKIPFNYSPVVAARY